MSIRSKKTNKKLEQLIRDNPKKTINYRYGSQGIQLYLQTIVYYIKENNQDKALKTIKKLIDDLNELDKDWEKLIK